MSSRHTKDKQDPCIDHFQIKGVAYGLGVKDYPERIFEDGSTRAIPLNKAAACMIWQAALQKSTAKEVEVFDQIRFLLRTLISLDSLLGGRNKEVGEFLGSKPSLESDKKHRKVRDIGLGINGALVGNKLSSNFPPFLTVKNDSLSKSSIVNEILIQYFLAKYAAKRKLKRSALKRCAKDLNRLLRSHRKPR